MTLESVVLGRTGIRVSRLCLGGWQAAGWQSSDEAVFVRTVEHALECGVNFIDTAPVYGKGRSEELIGRAIKGRRAQVVISSKCPPQESAPAKLRRALEGSLRRLGTDYLDLYQQHWPPKKPPLQETVAELEQLKAEGKLRAVGVSNWMAPEFEEIDDPARIEFLQPCYSLLWRSIEREVLPLCRRHGIAVMAYAPLCQGLLAGRFKDLESMPAAASDPRRHNIRFMGEQRGAVLKVVGEVEETARRCGRTPAQTALRWLLDQEGVSAVIVGASSPRQLDENLGALAWRLDEGERARLAEASAPLSAALEPHSTLWRWHPRE